jgi:hypothetical protein
MDLHAAQRVALFIDVEVERDWTWLVRLDESTSSCRCFLVSSSLSLLMLYVPMKVNGPDMLVPSSPSPNDPAFVRRHLTRGSPITSLNARASAALSSRRDAVMCR